MNNKFSPASATQSKYLNARYWLLLVLITSVLTVITVILNQTYFIISSYVTQILMSVGLNIYAETGEMAALIIMAVISIVFLVPYLLCCIFSKKHVGWMIAGLVIYGLDSLLFWGDFVAMLMYGEFGSIIDCVFRIFVIINLILAVKYGLQMKKEAAETPAVPASEATEEATDALYAQRTLTVTRKKAFTGSAMAVVVFENGKELCRLKNGETATVNVTGGEFELTAVTTNNLVQGSAKIPAGEASLNYVISLKMGAMANSFVIEPAVEG